MAEKADAWHQEGKARFQTDGAFYRPQSRMGRDLAVLAAAVYRRSRGELRILDAMSGCGVRSLRYALEAGADWVWANEANPEVLSVLRGNLQRELLSQAYRISQQDANQVFFTCHQQRDFYDLIDIDSFGGGAPYISTGLWATRLDGMLYLTSTDTRTTGGHNPDHSVQLYGAYARAHPASHEQGARLLIGSALQQAAARGLSIRPLFSYYSGHLHRVLVRLTSRLPWPDKAYGFLGYCYRCGNYQTLSWRQLGRAICEHPSQFQFGEPSPLVVSGPLWLGELHDSAFLAQMAEQAALWQWEDPRNLLTVMQHEATLPPYYFTLPEIGRRTRIDIPKREVLMQKLKDSGYRVSLTHFEEQAVKTDASWGACLAIAKSC